MLFAFPMKADSERALENLQKELNSLQCNAKLNEFSVIKLQDFYYYLPKKNFLYSVLRG